MDTDTKNSALISHCRGITISPKHDEGFLLFANTIKDQRVLNATETDLSFETAHLSHITYHSLQIEYYFPPI